MTYMDYCRMHVQVRTIHAYLPTLSPMRTTRRSITDLRSTSLVITISPDKEEAVPYDGNTDSLHAIHRYVSPTWFWVNANTWQEASPADRVLTLGRTDRSTLIYYMGTCRYVNPATVSIYQAAWALLQLRLDESER